jgi:hypothetical protein
MSNGLKRTWFFEELDLRTRFPYYVISRDVLGELSNVDIRMKPSGL